MADKKFQWSKFKNGKDEQFVVRGDSKEEFKEDVEWVIETYFDFATEMDALAEKPPRNQDMDEAIEEAKGCPKCEEVKYWVNLVKKEGKNKGKHFKTCRNCGEFLGFTNEALTNG